MKTFRDFCEGIGNSLEFGVDFGINEPDYDDQDFNNVRFGHLYTYFKLTYDDKRFIWKWRAENRHGEYLQHALEDLGVDSIDFYYDISFWMHDANTRKKLPGKYHRYVFNAMLYITHEFIRDFDPGVIMFIGLSHQHDNIYNAYMNNKRIRRAFDDLGYVAFFKYGKFMIIQKDLMSNT